MIPLAIILIPAFLFLLGILVLGVLTTWALFRYGGDFPAFFGSVLYWCASVFVIGLGLAYLAPQDWFTPLFSLSGLFGVRPF